MTNNPNPGEVSVDRRAETVVTQQPGYVASERVVRDVAAERRMQLFQVNRIIYSLLSLLEIVLGIRFVLKLIAANPGSGFASFIYGISGAFTAPFNALLGTPSAGGSALEVTTLVAMVIYALLTWIIVRVIQIVTDRPTARTVTRSTREQTGTGPGNERTTETITRN